jgi:hypothetical protein
MLPFRLLTLTLLPLGSFAFSLEPRADAQRCASIQGINLTARLNEILGLNVAGSYSVSSCLCNRDVPCMFSPHPPRK